MFLNPCISKVWPEFGVTYRRGRTTWCIQIKNPHSAEQGVETILVDGNIFPPNQGIHLIDDGQEHHIEAFLGPPNRANTDSATAMTNLVNHHPKNGSTMIRETALE